MFTQEDRIKKKLQDIAHYYVPIKKQDYHCINKLYNLFILGYYFDPDQNNSVELLYYGIYYRYFMNEKIKAKKYYEMAVDLGNVHAMNHLAAFYEDEKNYDLAKMWYIKAFKKGLSLAGINLGIFYNEIRKNFNKSKKYFMKEIKKNNFDAMNYFGYYCIMNKKYDLAAKYLMKVIKSGDHSAKKYAKICIDYLKSVKA